MSKAAADPRKKVERVVLQQLESLEQAGVMQLPKGKAAQAKHPHPGPLAEGEGVHAGQARRLNEERTSSGVVARSLFDGPAAENLVAPEQRGRPGSGAL